MLRTQSAARPPRCRWSPPVAAVGRRAVLAASLVLVPAAASAQTPKPKPAAGASHRARPARPAPPAFDVVEATIPELQAAMASGRLTAVQLVDAYVARIRAYDQHGPRLNAIIRLNPRARAEAAALDAERKAGKVRGPLHGIPVILKDNYDTADLPTSAGSVALAGVVPKQDATVVRKLREAGAIVLAKSNLHELASGITTISSLGGQTRNPYDPARNPGGSSGGSGAAAAASFAAIAYGSDTCGSIRIPAAVNDLFGLRPTKGLTSIAGIVPLAHTQDVVGPLARDVMDLAIGMDAIAGPDPADPATRILDGQALPRFVASLDTAALRGARLGVLGSSFGRAPEDQEAGRIVRAAIDSMKAHGAEVVDVAVPGLDSLVQRAGVIELEFRFDLKDYLARVPSAPVRSLSEILDKGLYDAALNDALRRRDTASTADSPPYRAALARRDTLRALVVQAMDEHRVDALVYPTMQRKAALLGEPARGSTCQLSAHTGLPALAAPAGFTADGLPVAVELLGRPLADARLVALAYAYEQAMRPRRPPPTTPPLVRGRAPEPLAWTTTTRAGPATAAVAFTWDPTTSGLRWSLHLTGAVERVYAVSLDRVVDDRKGPVIARLAGPDMTAADGTLTLTPAVRDDLDAGRLFLTLYTADAPLGSARSPLLPPGRAGAAQ
ncbi:MAG TPA: amidase family protein [Longimicrobiales bacterium]|nr:amidase family protein [Longimicrobiales bacterium]